MIKLSENDFLIGVDNGYQNVKTTNFLFENGIREMSVEPSIKEHTLFINGKYYKVGEGRARLSKDKVSDEANRLLCYTAVAQEMKKAKLKDIDLYLAVGVPFADYGKMKKPMIDYFLRDQEINFAYEGDFYQIRLKKVMVFPQCYSAVASRLANMKDDYCIVDIGSKTIDVVVVKDGIPNETRSTTIETALIKWMKHIQGELQSRFTQSIPESEILKVMLGKETRLPKECKDAISQMLTEFVDMVEKELVERDIDLSLMKIIYVGGGATIVKHFSRTQRDNVAYDCDIAANAKGYEFLAERLLGR